jgi:hypothetical protein
VKKDNFQVSSCTHNSRIQPCGTATYNNDIKLFVYRQTHNHVTAPFITEMPAIFKPYVLTNELEATSLQQARGSGQRRSGKILGLT